jgi:16S rRNA (adenine1518-N6/adenine1519-N6)-dimethyltransferase
MKAKKSLGQHFLKSEKALRQIIDAGDIHADDIVLEIGPGHGVLTERLLKLAGKVIAIEKDRELIPLLEEKFTREIQEGKLDIVEQDVLEFNPETLRFYEKPYKLIANIPYYITGAIIEQFLSTAYQPELMVLLMQKEVADRIVAKDKKEGILSIAVKAYGAPKIVGIVPPGAFAPAPTVDSAVLLIENISREFFSGVDETLFFKIMKTCFGQKRKQLGHTLALLYKKEEFLPLLEQTKLSPKVRPEELSKEQWKLLSTTLSKLAILQSNGETK